jgi:hypothetical protein
VRTSGSIKGLIELNLFLELSGLNPTPTTYIQEGSSGCVCSHEVLQVRRDLIEKIEHKQLSVRL